MKFLLDSNLSHRVAQLLRDAGIDAAHVRDNDLQHATDSMILDFARQHAFVLVTLTLVNCWLGSARSRRRSCCCAPTNP